MTTPVDVDAGLAGVAVGRLCDATGVGNGSNGLAAEPGVSGADVAAGRQLAKAKTARAQIVETILRRDLRLVTFILRHLFR